MIKKLSQTFSFLHAKSLQVEIPSTVDKIVVNSEMVFPFGSLA